MSQWDKLFINVALSALGAALIYQLPLYLFGNTGPEESKWLIILVRILFFTFYPIIPLALTAGITQYLVEKYQLIEKQQRIAYTAASGVIYLSIYLLIWNNLPLYSIAPTLAGPAIFVYLQIPSKPPDSLNT